MKFESLKNRKFNKIWNGHVFNKFRSFMQKGCAGCKAFNKCTKCIAQSFRFFRKGYFPTPYCIRNADALGLKNIDLYKKKLDSLGIKL